MMYLNRKAHQGVLGYEILKLKTMGIRDDWKEKLEMGQPRSQGSLLPRAIIGLASTRPVS